MYKNVMLFTIIVNKSQVAFRSNISGVVKEIREQHITTITQSLKDSWEIFQMTQENVSDFIIAKGNCGRIKCSSAMENSFLGSIIKHVK